ncbi:MAG: hypothetical protein HOC71_08470, partial [Candidatus Latescibacteria bacterium]|nr:hypothetical protein [Candidatus Latescibacterota bacterium]
EAIEKMESGFEHVYKPEPGRAKIYAALFKKYTRFGAFVEQETENDGIKYNDKA